MKSLLALIIFGAVLSACTIPRDGRDGMDGYGVAAGLHHELNRDRR